MATKLYIPKIKHGYVRRNTLIDKLSNSISKKLILVSAPAGFGKTTLLAEWVSKIDFPAAWVSLETSDNDPVCFFNYMTEALNTVIGNMDEQISLVLKSPEIQSYEFVLIQIIEKLADFKKDLVLILDDYHNISNPKVHQHIEFLIKHLPPNCRLLVASRSDPPFSLAKYRVNNIMAEIRFSDLSFTRTEIYEFFRDVISVNLSDDDIDLLKDRTEGWIAGLQMAALSMKGCKDISTFIRAFAGDNRHIVDYLLDEVLAFQSEHIQNFLFQTSILDQMNKDLCNFICRRDDCQEILMRLDKDNLFIIPLDDKRYWYRYHHLFRNLLQEKLYQNQKNKALELHKKASQWYESKNLKADAIDHTLAAEEYEQALVMIESICETYWNLGQRIRVLNWMECLPLKLLRTVPNLCFLYAIANFQSGNYKRAIENLKATEELINSNMDSIPKGARSLSNIEIKELKGKLFAMKAMSHTTEENVDKMLEYSQKAIKYLPETTSFWHEIALMCMGSAYFSKGNIPAAIGMFQHIAKENEAIGNIDLAFIVNNMLIQGLRFTGRLDEAVEICQKQFKNLKKQKLEKTVHGGSVYVMWGDILYELGQLDESLRYLREGSELAEQGHDTAELAWAYNSMMMTLAAKGDMKGVEHFRLKFNRIKDKCNLPPWVSRANDTWQAKLWLIKNQEKKVADWIEERQLKPEQQITPILEPSYIILIRFLILKDELDVAEILLDVIIKNTEKGERVLLQIEALLIKALIEKKKGNDEIAVSILKKSLILAEPGGYIQIFINEGREIAELLSVIIPTIPLTLKKYAEKLSSAFEINKHYKSQNTQLVEDLSDREIEILELVAAGLSNQKIGEALFISINTVKSHLSTIYGKLDVHSRTRAIARAKELNCL